jgi:hypothetical protein
MDDASDESQPLYGQPGEVKGQSSVKGPDPEKPTPYDADAT